MTRFGTLALVAALLAVVAIAVVNRRPASSESTWPPVSAGVRQELLRELKPVVLQNCTLRRYGSANDGGYLMCANLTDSVAAAYSYGIDQEDNWGCDVSRQLGVPIHQYDCFTDQRPSCSGGRFIFHDECVGPRRERLDGQPFDTVAAQIAANGDTGRQLLVKVDIEGAEWESLLATPDAVLDTFVQLPMELHLRGADEARFLELVKRLNQRFYLANLHFNNFACSTETAPLPATAFQVLWVNKRVAVVDGSAQPAAPSPLNAPDGPDVPDCQLPAEPQ
jgi:hypothetical protein